jgi:hypothetical protein
VAVKCPALWALLVGGLVLLVAAGAWLSGWRSNLFRTRVDDLIAQSRSGESLYWQPGPQRLRWDDVPNADRHIRSQPDFSSYFLLMTLLEDWPDSYRQIPKETRAAVLCSALSHARVSNDWGWLSPADGGYDYPPARALLDTGDVAVKYLTPVLDDRGELIANGSAEATQSIVYRYRRCDFAYRYICVLRGLEPLFARTPEKRDKEIDRLKVALATKEGAR